jgi:hypothetical protein
MTSPLSPPVDRETLHFRDYEFSGHRRADGLFDIEGRMVDRKSYAFPNDWRGMVEAGKPVHEMWVRVTLNKDLLIEYVEAATSASPFAACPAIAPAFAALKGETIKPGWSNLLKEKFGGRRGCTHHVEMLRALGTVAFQTIHGWRERQRREGREAGSTRPPDASGRIGKRPGLIDSCYALAADGETVRRHFPQFYEGLDASSDKANA